MTSELKTGLKRVLTPDEEKKERARVRKELKEQKQRAKEQEEAIQNYIEELSKKEGGKRTGPLILTGPNRAQRRTLRKMDQADDTLKRKLHRIKLERHGIRPTQKTPARQRFQDLRG